MKTIDEKKQYFGIKDNKARRRANTSTQTANITAVELEKGVTIEKLESVNVPIYRYGTQVTIHGKLPDFCNSYINGYKSIFKNQNGSIGVKYTAIDGAKKKTILRVDRLTECRMSPQINSNGFHFVKSIANETTAQTVETGRAFVKSIPDCFAGHKQLLRGQWGDLFVAVSLSSIYEKDLYKFLDWLTFGKVTSQADIVTLEQDKKKQDDIDSIEYDKKAKIEQDQKDVLLANLSHNLRAQGLKYYDGPIFDGLYIVKIGYFGDSLQHISFKKHGKKYRTKKTSQYMKNTPEVKQIDTDCYTWQKARMTTQRNITGFIFS